MFGQLYAPSSSLSRIQLALEQNRVREIESQLCARTRTLNYLLLGNDTEDRNLDSLQKV